MIYHTYGGFRGNFVLLNKRAPTPQEIFDAGMRGGRDIVWPRPVEPMTKEKFIDVFEEVIQRDPAAYGRPGEVVYQVTKKELEQMFEALLS